MSAQTAATMIGRPRIEPELSISSETTVSRNSISSSLLERQREVGVDDHAGQARRIEHAFLQVEVPGAVLLRQELALQPVGQARDDACRWASCLSR